jgi:hypothetical protein
MKTIILIAGILCSFAGYSVTPLERMGGMVVQPGSQKGKIVILNAQNMMSDSDIAKTIDIMSKLTPYKFEVLKVKQDTAYKVAKNSDNPVKVLLLNDNDTPSLLASPDEHWAAVNVSKMSKNLKSERAKNKFFASRCRKQLMRAFVYACGGAGSAYQHNILAIKELEELDFVDEFIPEDAYDACRKFLADKGIHPERKLVYVRACQEGWAPAPTNQFQKVIWDKIHALPKNPIKIKPETKKVRE